MTLKEQKEQRFYNLCEIVDSSEINNYYINHTFDNTVEWLSHKYPQFKKCDFQRLLMTNRYKKDKNSIQELRISTNNLRYGGGSGRSISNYIPTKDELYDLYVIKRMSIRDISNKLNISGRKVLFYKKLYKVQRDRVSDYVSKDTILEKRKNSCLLKYGVDNPMKNAQIKQKAINTLINRYGVDYGKKLYLLAMNSYKDKTGFDNPFQDVENIRESLLEKYGVENSNNIPGVKEKAKLTWHTHYDDTDNFNELIKRRDSTNYIINGATNYRNVEKCQQTCLFKYGVTSVLLLPDIKFSLQRANSQPNVRFSNLLDGLNIQYEREFRISNRFYDFKVDNYLIEINPTITHNSTFSLFKNQGLPKYYHYEKSKLAKDSGYFCLHVFDWTDVTLILNIIKNKLIKSSYFKGIERIIFDMRSRRVVQELTPNCVEVYTDGQVFEYFT